jgi:hypothetical protein
MTVANFSPGRRRGRVFCNATSNGADTVVVIGIACILSPAEALPTGVGG